MTYRAQPRKTKGEYYPRQKENTATELMLDTQAFEVFSFYLAQVSEKRIFRCKKTLDSWKHQ